MRRDGLKPFEFIKTDKGEVIAKGSYIAHESHVYITTKKQEVWDFFRKIQAKKQQIEYIEFTEYSIYSGPFIISSLSKDNETHKITVFLNR